MLCQMHCRTHIIFIMLAHDWSPCYKKRVVLEAVLQFTYKLSRLVEPVALQILLDDDTHHPWQLTMPSGDDESGTPTVSGKPRSPVPNKVGSYKELRIPKKGSVSRKAIVSRTLLHCHFVCPIMCTSSQNTKFSRGRWAGKDLSD